MALIVLLDTNRLTDVLAGDAKVDEILERAEEVWVPFVAIAEIRAGFLGGRMPVSGTPAAWPNMEG